MSMPLNVNYPINRVIDKDNYIQYLSRKKAVVDVREKCMVDMTTNANKNMHISMTITIYFLIYYHTLLAFVNF